MPTGLGSRPTFSCSHTRAYQKTLVMSQYGTGSGSPPQPSAHRQGDTSVATHTAGSLNARLNGWAPSGDSSSATNATSRSPCARCLRPPMTPSTRGTSTGARADASGRELAECAGREPEGYTYSGSASRAVDPSCWTAFQEREGLHGLPSSPADAPPTACLTPPSSALYKTDQMITLSAWAGLVPGRIAGCGRARRRSAGPRVPFMSLALFRGPRGELCVRCAHASYSEYPSRAVTSKSLRPLQGRRHATHRS